MRTVLWTEAETLVLIKTYTMITAEILVQIQPSVKIDRRRRTLVEKLQVSVRSTQNRNVDLKMTRMFLKFFKKWIKLTEVSWLSFDNQAYSLILRAARRRKKPSPSYLL